MSEINEEMEAKTARVERVKKMAEQGYSEIEIAQTLGMSTTELRTLRTEVKDAENKALLERARELENAGYSNTNIAIVMGITENELRTLLK